MPRPRANTAFTKRFSPVFSLFPAIQPGGIDFDPIFESLKDAGFTGWIVVEAEQDPEKADPLWCAKTARKFLQEKLGI